MKIFMGIIGGWRFDLVKLWKLLVITILSSIHPNPTLCWSLNEEGLALLKLKERIEKDPCGALSNWNENELDMDPCSSFGVESSDRKVVIFVPHRKLLQEVDFLLPFRPDRVQAPQSPSQFNPAFSPSPSPAFVSTPPAFVFTRNPDVAQKQSPASTPSQVPKKSNSKHHLALILAFVFCGTMVIIVICIVLYRRETVVAVGPWATGLSGQLQKAFVNGVPKLKRAELEAACEDFSNIIGTFSDGTIYKGTLSSGVEIAVTSSSISSKANWSKNLNTQFRNKIDTLSKMNHKNFINLIGFCEENVPFTRMMVFEYAPNGTLYEHLHIQEAEHLDWGMRVRIAMGIAYCLEHMHQLIPPITHKNLQSSYVYLTDDYAAKIGDLSYWEQPKSVSATMEVSESPTASNVYSFGAILYEIITGRNLHSAGNETADPTLISFDEEMFENLIKLIKVCVDTDHSQRPTMREVVAQLRQITAMEPSGATPKISPLWWAELEITSADDS